LKQLWKQLNVVTNTLPSLILAQILKQYLHRLVISFVMRDSQCRIDEFLIFPFGICNLNLLRVVNQIKISRILFLQVVQNFAQQGVVFLYEFWIQEEGSAVVDVNVGDCIEDVLVSG